MDSSTIQQISKVSLFQLHAYRRYRALKLGISRELQYRGTHEGEVQSRNESTRIRVSSLVREEVKKSVELMTGSSDGVQFVDEEYESTC